MTTTISQTIVPAESMQQIDDRIRKTFTVLGKVANGMVGRHIRAVIVSGAAGCGKTHTMEKSFKLAEKAGKISYQSVRGAMSPIGLYKLLYECSEEGSILGIDDCDSIFGDIDALNLLKCSLDTGKTRTVHWNKESKVLDGEGIPREFEFNGAVAFITNIDFVREIARETKMAMHYRALMSRCLYVDLGIHSRREIIVRIGQVVYSQEFLRENELEKAEAQKMMAWLVENLPTVRVLSIRTILQLAALVKTDGNWQDMADALMLHR